MNFTVILHKEDKNKSLRNKSDRAVTFVFFLHDIHFFQKHVKDKPHKLLFRRVSKKMTYLQIET